MTLYEHTVIARQDLSSQQAQTLTEALSQVVTDTGGTVVKAEYWGLRNLSFRVAKNRKGHYLHFNIDGPAAAIAELERNEGIHEDVIRFLTVKVDAVEEGPSIMMQVRQSREERGHRGDGDRPRRDEDRPRRDDDRPRRDDDRPRRDRGEMRS